MKLRSSEWAWEDAEKRNQLLQREMEEFFVLFFFFNHGTLDCWGKRCQSAEVKESAEFVSAACLPSRPSTASRGARAFAAGPGPQWCQQIRHRLERAVLTPYQKPELHRSWSCSGSGGCPHHAGCGRYQSGQPHNHQNRWHLGSE